MLQEIKYSGDLDRVNPSMAAAFFVFPNTLEERESRRLTLHRSRLGVPDAIFVADCPTHV